MRLKSQSCFNWFYNKCYFRKAKIVDNHFHWTRYACNALDKIRIEVQSNLPKSERKYLNMLEVYYF